MRENYRNSIASIKKFPQFTTMHVIDSQAGLIICASLIFYSLTIDNILNIIILLILATVTILALTGENGLFRRAKQAKTDTGVAQEKEQIQLEVMASWETNGELNAETVRDNLNEKIKGIEEITGTNFPLTVKYSSTGNTYSITSDGNVEQKIQQDRTGIQVGDYIDYEPTAGTYSKDKLAESYTGNNDSSYNNADLITGVGEGETKTVEKWRILKIYEDGKMDIIGDPTSYTVRFGGATGYNNGVYIMHDICKALYSNSTHGIEARSVSLEDFENNMTTAGRTARDEYNKNSTNCSQYGHTNYEKWESAYTNYRYYPNIYAKENGSGIDTENGAVKTDGIKDTAKDELDNSTGSSAYKQATTGLTTKQTYYSIEINSTNYGDAYKALDNSNTFWVASRCVECWKTYMGSACFGLRYAGRQFILWKQHIPIGRGRDKHRLGSSPRGYSGVGGPSNSK